MSIMQKNRKKIPKYKKKKHKFSDGICPNCGVRDSHFCPPGFGDPGFFICKKKENNNG